MPDYFKSGYSLFGHYISSDKESAEKPTKIKIGQRIAEMVASFIGSWKFVIGQSIFLFIWISLNIVMISYSWDPYPFILMNLFLSTQAAYTAPLILMSQNRQSAQDRSVLYEGWNIDKKINNTITEMEYDIDNRLKQQDVKLDIIIEGLNKNK